MKIDGPASLRSTAPRRARKDGETSGDFASHFTTGERAERASLAGAASRLGSIDALIALQGAPDSGERGRSHEVDRARDLLDRLDELRVGLLTGRLSRATLQAIVERLDARRREGGDPRLARVIDEIELRARVELAKLSVA